MPSGMRTLTGLHKLNKFVIGEGNLNLKQHVELEGLKALKNLRGKILIEIHFPKNGKFANCDGIRDGAYMMDKEHLHGKHGGNNVLTGYEEDLLGALQPHTNLKNLTFKGYHGVRLPRWTKDDSLASSPPNLVTLSLYQCSELKDLPSLEKLCQLKTLELVFLPNLEYIEISHVTTSSPASNGEDLSLLPCLEEIYFDELPKLKRWWRRSVTGLSDNSVNSSNEIQQTSYVALLRLKNLRIIKCPEFICLPYCPNVEKLSLFEFNKKLQIIANKGSHELIELTSSTSYPSTDYPKQRDVSTDNLAWLCSSLPLAALQSLNSLKINGDKELESLTELEQVFCACSSSLKTLRLFNCPKLRCLSGGLTFLTRLLAGLPIMSFVDKKIDGDGEEDEMPWGSLCHSLQYLDVYCCKELESFPKWFRKLDSLIYLEVQNCSANLYERCQSGTGEDWPNIRHIPHRLIRP